MLLHFHQTGSLTLRKDRYYLCFMYWKKTFDRAEWTKLLDILKNTDYSQLKRTSIHSQFIHGTKSETAPRSKGNKK